MLNIKQTVVDELRQILEKLPDGTEIDESMTLNSDLGMSSLQLAELVATLEDRFGYDPFREHVPITEVRTVGDLCAAYAATRKDGETELHDMIRDRAVATTV